MSEKESAAIRLADATVRWLTAGRVRDLVARKSTAMAISALVSGDRQEFPEESPRVESEYNAAHVAWQDAVRDYFVTSPESVPKYEHVHLTAEQRRGMADIEWLAKVTNGAMRA